MTALAAMPLDLGLIFRSCELDLLGDSVAAADLRRMIVENVVLSVPDARPGDVNGVIDTYYQHLSFAVRENRRISRFTEIVSETNDTVRAARTLWLALLKDRRVAWGATFRLLNDESYLVRYIAREVLEYLSSTASNLSQIDLLAAVHDLRCIVAGNNLYALHTTLDLLIRAQAPPAIVALVLENNRDLVDDLLRVEQVATRQLVERFVAMTKRTRD